MMKRLVPLFLSVALVLCASVLFMQWRRASAAEHTLQETYLSALGESAELMQDLSLDLEKLLISHDQSRQAELMGQISRNAGDVRRSLAHLPLSQAELSPVMSFTGDLADRSAALLASLVQTGSLAAPDLTLLEDDLAQCTLFSGQLASVQEDILAGQLPLTAAVPSDMPASQAAALPNAKGLPPTTVNLGQAMTIASQFVGMERVNEVSSTSHVTSGSIPAWGVAVHTNDLLLNLEVTRTGGKVLMMSPETAGFEPLRSVQDCIAAASAFLESREFSNMERVWSQVYDGMCVVTFASVQEGVLIYPDLVTIQVRMDTGEAVGLEAHNYWMNHTPRRLSEPALSEEEARAKLSPEVTEQGARLCIIPQGSSELLCYEFTVTRGDETYLIYIDAATGREAALQKIVMLENGAMAA